MKGREVRQLPEHRAILIGARPRLQDIRPDDAKEAQSE
jgi:hypothetical protein